MEESSYKKIMLIIGAAYLMLCLAMIVSVVYSDVQIEKWILIVWVIQAALYSIPVYFWWR